MGEAMLDRVAEEQPEDRHHTGLILVVILEIYGIGFLILAGPILSCGTLICWYLVVQVVGSMFYTLFLGLVTGGVIWAGKKYLLRRYAADWRKPVLWGTGFWAVMTLLARFNILMKIHGEWP
ncbi:MAG: hypothetical protein HQL80_03960 [Magnetococcales bacterium]|nr:hypothetical protein [Magnetococcales bacterium]